MSETIYYYKGIPGRLVSGPNLNNHDLYLWQPLEKVEGLYTKWMSMKHELTTVAPAGMEQQAAPPVESVTQSAAQPDRKRDKTWNPDTDPAPAPPDQRVRFDTAARAVVVEAAGGARWDMAAGRYLIRCEACGVDFHSARPHTRSCSPKCRKALSRK